MRTFILTLTLLLLSQGLVNAQGKTNWRKYRDLAREYFKSGKYEEAAENYQKAWELKPKKTELLYQAAQSYDLVEDYQNAVSALVHLTAEREDYPLAQYLYAKNLKKSGEYAAAKSNFIEFLNTYDGPDKANYIDKVDRAVEGCDMAMQMEPDPDVEIILLPEAINSPKADFAPMPIGEDILYFSSTRRANKLKIYFSQLQEDGWTRAELPNRLPKIWAEHYGNGTLSADGKRFYYTQCAGAEEGELRSRCELYMIENNNGVWSDPQALPEYINMEGITSTHPYTFEKDGFEYIYYASDREDGQGGLDIWYTKRELGSGSTDFSFPDNVGPRINTAGDEISPFYDVATGELYFSSNGHISLGGFDSYRSKGAENSWSSPENLGFPLNSPANDNFFVLKPGGGSGYLVSNRPMPSSKIKTTHEDIFTFNIAEEETPLLVKGRVFEEGSLDLVDGAAVQINLYENGGVGASVAETATEDGFFNTEVPPGQEYRVLVSKDDYNNTEYFFNTILDPVSGEIEMDIYLEPIAEAPALTDIDQPIEDEETIEPDNEVLEQVEEPEPEEIAAPEPETINEPAPLEEEEPGEEIATAPPAELEETEPADNEPIQPIIEEETAAAAEVINDRQLESMGGTYTYTTTYGNDYTLTSSAPRREGTYYKVQFITLSKSLPEFPEMRDLGRVDTELIEDKKWTRYLVGDFYSLQEAEFVLQDVQSRGYHDAFIARYEDGLRNADIYENFMLSYIKLD